MAEYSRFAPLLHHPGSTPASSTSAGSSASGGASRSTGDTNGYHTIRPTPHGEVGVEGDGTLLEQSGEVEEESYDGHGAGTKTADLDERAGAGAGAGAREEDTWNPLKPANGCNHHGGPQGSEQQGRDEQEEEENEEQDEDEQEQDDVEEPKERDAADPVDGGDTGRGSSSGSLHSRHFGTPQRPQHAPIETQQQQQQQHHQRGLQGVDRADVNDARPLSGGNNTREAPEWSHLSHLSQEGDIYEQEAQHSPSASPEQDRFFCHDTQEHFPQEPSQQTPQVENEQEENQHEENQREVIKQKESQQEEEQPQQPQACDLNDISEVRRNEKGENSTNNDPSDLVHSDHVRGGGGEGVASGSLRVGRSGASGSDSFDSFGYSPFERPGREGLSSALGTLNSGSEVGHGGATNGRVGPRRSNLGERERNGDAVVMEDGKDGESSDDELVSEGEPAAAWKRDEGEAIFRGKVDNGFLRIASCYISASSAIKRVKVKQKNMLKGEDEIREGLMKFGKRLREATDAMEVQIHAMFGGEDSGSEKEPPRAVLLDERGRGRAGRARKSRRIGATAQHLPGELVESSTTEISSGGHGRWHTPLSESPSMSNSSAASRADGGSSGGEQLFPQNSPIRPSGRISPGNYPDKSHDRFNGRHPPGSFQAERSVSRGVGCFAKPGLQLSSISETVRMPIRGAMSDGKEKSTSIVEMGGSSIAPTVMMHGGRNTNDINREGAAGERPFSSHVAAVGAQTCDVDSHNKHSGGGGGGGGASSSFTKRPRYASPQSAEASGAGAAGDAGGWSFQGGF